MREVFNFVTVIYHQFVSIHCVTSTALHSPKMNKVSHHLVFDFPVIIITTAATVLLLLIYFVKLFRGIGLEGNALGKRVRSRNGSGKRNPKEKERAINVERREEEKDQR